MTRKPRVLFVARTRYALPLADGLARKWDALAEVLVPRVVASPANGHGYGDERFRLIPRLPAPGLDGAAFYARLPAVAAEELRRFRPDAVVAQSPYEAAGVLAGRSLAGTSTRVIVEVHGDWRTFTRLYGSPARRLLDPLADRLAGAALRRADAVRAVSPYTARLVRDAGREPAAVFPAFSDYEAFRAAPPRPLPDQPVALFVGVLERYKNADGLAAAWRRVVARLPDARLRIVGEGTLAPLVERLVAELPDRVEWTRRLAPGEVAAALDAASLLVLPSRSEGMGRVAVEAFCRGRPVVGAAAGGIVDLVQERVNGLLVDPSDVAGLADALVRALSDRALLERLAAGASASAERWVISADEFAQRMRELVEEVAG